MLSINLSVFPCLKVAYHWRINEIIKFKFILIMTNQYWKHVIIINQWISSQSLHITPNSTNSIPQSGAYNPIPEIVWLCKLTRLWKLDGWTFARVVRPLSLLYKAYNLDLQPTHLVSIMSSRPNNGWCVSDTTNLIPASPPNCILVNSLVIHSIEWLRFLLLSLLLPDGNSVSRQIRCQSTFKLCSTALELTHRP